MGLSQERLIFSEFVKYSNICGFPILWDGRSPLILNNKSVLYFVTYKPLIRMEIMMIHLMKQGVVVRDDSKMPGSIVFSQDSDKMEFLLHDTLFDAIVLGKQIFPNSLIKVAAIGHTEGIVYKIDATSPQKNPFSALPTFKADEETNQWHLASMKQIPRH